MRLPSTAATAPASSDQRRGYWRRAEPEHTPEKDKEARFSEGQEQ